jgi:Rieske 2Fe-2S family protein
MRASLNHVKKLIASRREGYALPRAFYFDSVLYGYELERIWRSGWVFAGFTCQVRQPGDFFTFTLDTASVIVVRDEAGQIRAFHNVCMHRGTLLYKEDSGNARAIVCPYHQWTYSLRGDLLSCYGMQDSIDKSNLGLQMLRVEICEGLIFVSFSMSPPPFETARQFMATYAKPQGFEQAKVAKIIAYEIHANWKLVWENNRECYHCNVNHPQYIKSNFDIYENGHSSARIEQRLKKALARSETAWQAEGITITHRQGGLAAFPDADNDIWSSTDQCEIDLVST